MMFRHHPTSALGVVATLALVLVAFSSGTAAQQSLDAPQQVHIAYRGLGYDMVVSWLTANNVAAPMVKFGTASGTYSASAPAKPDSYTNTSMIYNAVLPGLNPATKYYYICGDSAAGWSMEFSFTTAPKSGSTEPFSIAVYGDLGSVNGIETSSRLTERIDEFDFFFHVGDFSYADDRLGGYEEVWDQWQSQMEPITAHKPYMVCPGNHEATCHSFGDWFCPESQLNFTAYTHRFRMPGPESGSNTTMWSSFDYGMAHFIMIDTETDIGPYSPEGPDTIWKAGGFGDQLAWLKKDLEKAQQNRAERPWLIVGGHRPMYTTSHKSKIVWVDATQHLREQVEELFHQYQVDFYLCGHVHAYERMYPVYQNKTVQTGYNDPDALTHLVVGGAGNIEGIEGDWGDDESWLAYRERHDFGFGKLDILDEQHAKWSFYRSRDNALLDEFELFRSHKFA